MSAAGPPQGTRPLGGAARGAVRGEHTSAAGPSAAAPDAAFLIHGLGGTQYDLGSMHKRLKNAGLVTYSLTLPGHGTKAEDLASVTAENWVEAVVAKYREIRDDHPTVHLMGMCMGSLLAALLAARERHAKGNLVMLAPPVYIDGWATPWYRFLRPVLYAVPGLPRRMKIEEEDPFGIKNEQLRAIVKAKFERGENFHYRWVPLECIRQVDRLRAMVMKAASHIQCPTLVVHAREDELTSLRSADFMVKAIGGGRARMVILEDSYHMICVDNDREIVAKNVLEFLGAALPGAGSALANEPRMSVDELTAALKAVLAKLGAGELTNLRELAIPDLSWVHPGANAVSGVHVGKAFGTFASRFGALGNARFTAFGTPVFNRGVVLVPAQLVASNDSARLESPGALLLAFHAGKLLEARWFADQVELEDAFFGEAPAPDNAAIALDAAFVAATVEAKALTRPPENATLLDLYALYKQADAGDVAGDRPSVLDVVGRAKYDAWAKRKGVSRDEAMQAYVALVGQLKAQEVPA
jgi:carboxylesterase